MKANKWLKLGSTVKINNHNLFYYDSKNSTNINKPVLIILHGYPTCSFDYYKALPYLENHFRVIIHDHLGFGFSDKPTDYSYSLVDQAEIALKFWNKLGIKVAHLLAHDYGTSVATEVIAQYNENRLHSLELLSVTLCNGSIHIELAKLRLIQKLLLNKLSGPIIARLSNINTLRRNLKNIYFDKSKVTQVEIDALWKMMTHNNGRKVLHKTTQYIKQRSIFWDRWIGALKETDLPVHIVWAINDPVAIVKIAELIHQECQHSDLTLLEGLGHFPMLEGAKQWSDAVITSINHTLRKPV